MSTTTPKPATTPIPVQLSEPEFETFILPHLSMPKRGPKCKLGYYRVFNLILSHSIAFRGNALCSVRESSIRIWTRQSAKTWTQPCSRSLVSAVHFA